MQITNKDYLLDKETLFNHYFSQNNDEESLNKNIQSIHLFLNTDFIKNSLDEQQEFVNSLLTFIVQYNLDSLSQYLLYSDNLPIKPQLKYNNYEALFSISENNSTETGLILFDKFYQDLIITLPEDKQTIPEDIFKNLCFNNCNVIIDKILSYPKSFYKKHLNSAFLGACLGGNLEICEKILQTSIEKKDNKLYSAILDDYPFHTQMYYIIDFNKNMLDTKDKIKILDYLLNNPSLDPKNYPDYIQSSTYKEISDVDPIHLIYIAYSYGFTNIIDFLLDQINIKNIILPFINEDLIKKLVEKKPFFDENIVINYFIMDLGIVRTPTLYSYLDNVIKNDKIQDKKRIAQTIMDLYDMIEFNDKLEYHAEKKSIQKKKKL